MTASSMIIPYVLSHCESRDNYSVFTGVDPISTDDCSLSIIIADYASPTRSDSGYHPRIADSAVILGLILYTLLFRPSHFDKVKLKIRYMNDSESKK